MTVRALPCQVQRSAIWPAVAALDVDPRGLETDLGCLMVVATKKDHVLLKAPSEAVRRQWADELVQAAAECSRRNEVVDAAAEAEDGSLDDTISASTPLSRSLRRDGGLTRSDSHASHSPRSEPAAVAGPSRRYSLLGRARSHEGSGGLDEASFDGTKYDTLARICAVMSTRGVSTSLTRRASSSQPSSARTEIDADEIAPRSHRDRTEIDADEPLTPRLPSHTPPAAATASAASAVAAAAASAAVASAMLGGATGAVMGANSEGGAEYVASEMMATVPQAPPSAPSAASGGAPSAGEWAPPLLGTDPMGGEEDFMLLRPRRSSRDRDERQREEDADSFAMITGTSRPVALAYVYEGQCQGKKLPEIITSYYDTLGRSDSMDREADAASSAAAASSSSAAAASSSAAPPPPALAAAAATPRPRTNSSPAEAGKMTLRSEFAMVAGIDRQTASEHVSQFQERGLTTLSAMLETFFEEAALGGSGPLPALEDGGCPSTTPALAPVAHESKGDGAELSEGSASSPKDRSSRNSKGSDGSSSGRPVRRSDAFTLRSRGSSSPPASALVAAEARFSAAPSPPRPPDYAVASWSPSSGTAAGAHDGDPGPEALASTLPLVHLGALEFVDGMGVPGDGAVEPSGSSSPRSKSRTSIGSWFGGSSKKGSGKQKL